jgi:hypothetical protein
MSNRVSMSGELMCANVGTVRARERQAGAVG